MPRPHKCKVETIIYEHGTHFVFPESMLKMMLPVGSSIFMRIAFQSAKHHLKECHNTRLDINQRIKNAVKEWKSR